MIFKALRKRGKSLLSVQQGFDLKDKYGRFGFRVNQAAAELVREEIIERMWRLRMAKVNRGGWIGHRPPFGYRIDRAELVPDVDEQRVIRYIRRLRRWCLSKSRGSIRVVKHLPMTLREICEILNARALKDTRYLPKNGQDNQAPTTAFMPTFMDPGSSTNRSAGDTVTEESAIIARASVTMNIIYQ